MMSSAVQSVYWRRSAMAPNPEEAEEKLRGILQKAVKVSLSADALSRLQGVKKLLRNTSQTPKAFNSLLPLFAGVISVTIALLYCLGLYTHAGFARIYMKWQGVDLYEELCAIYMPDQLVKAFRPPEDCFMCQGVTQIDKVTNISPDIFEERYAYNGRPVVVKDAMENWTAQHAFSFEFFKRLYGGSLDHWNYQMGCQFFPYETEFRDLREVFNMSEDRANMNEGTKPWYIGWSNCDDRTARILRRHYGRPYFLPDTAENKKLDWIFMGSPGYGAHMHVDNVEHPSWQAQLRGSKKWVLEPPPECYYHCNRVEVTVEKGEIIVLDTNRWYHSTLITSKEMSITIGAEYD